MQLQSLCLVFFICLSIASTEHVNAFNKTPNPSRKISLRNNEDSLISTTISSATAALNSEKEQAVSAGNGLKTDLSNVILNTNGGSTVFPPPILTRGLIATERRVIEEERRNNIGAKRFLSKHKATITAMCLMGFTGVVESICYRRFHVYPNMMTGNTVRAMEAISSMRVNEIQVSLGLIGSYISGGTLYKFLDRARVFSQNKRKKIPTMVWLSAISFVFFGLSDVVGMMTPAGFDLMRLLPLATAFGMINCATQEMTGLVTNAATGHYGKIGFGLGELIVMNMLPRSAGGEGHEPNRTTIKNGIVSALAIGSFVTALISTNLIGLWLDAKHPWVYAKLPPLGLALGTAYATLLTSYHFFSKKSEKYL